MGTNLTNKHRYFVQFMLNNGMVPLDKAVSFLEEISPDEHSLTHLKTLIIEINREISNHFFKIVSTVCEVTAEKVFIWMNTKNDAISRLQIGFTAVELEYFHAIMKEIITSEDHKLLYPRVINISSTLTATLSRENGQRALTKWINGGYFVKLDENVYLGPRTILEFTSYLKANTENCSCDLCSELVFVGEGCPSCNKTFHKDCIGKYLRNKHTCPSCKSDWEEVFQGSSNMEIDPEPSQSQRRRTRK